MPRHRGLVHRLLAGVLALLFATSATEGGMAHACPMHDGTMVTQVLAAAVAGDGGADTAAAGHDAHAMAGHAGHDAAPAAPATGGHGDHGAGHQCTCPGTACSTGVAAMATPRLSTHFGIAVADVRAVFAPAAAHRPTRVPHATPFANGPPAAALA